MCKSILATMKQQIRRLIPCLCILSLLFLGGCRALFELPIDGLTAYDTKQYAVASKLLAEDYAVEKDVIVKADLAYKIGECYRRSNQPEKAEEWYAKAVEYSNEPLTSFYYGLSLKSNGKYKEAIRVFRDYSLGNPSDRDRATRQIQACKQALEWIDKPTDYEVISLKGVNTPASDFAPVLFKDNQLVFTSAREKAKGEDLYGWTGEKHSDIFIASQNKDFSISRIAQISDTINTEFNEGTVTFNPDYTEMYFTSCGSKNTADDFCKIYLSRWFGGKWSTPEKVVLFEDGEEINVGHPFMASNGKQLYFAAETPEGQGNKDLYVVTRDDDGYWEEPINLGPQVNTPGYEGFPHISADGKLYFASDGHIGMGGLDIFYVEQKNGKWGEVQNMGTPINSSSDDFSIVFSPYVRPELLDSVEAYGYFSSSRKGGVGNDDIYRFELRIPSEPIVVEVPEEPVSEPTPPPKEPTPPPKEPTPPPKEPTPPPKEPTPPPKEPTPPPKEPTPPPKEPTPPPKEPTPPPKEPTPPPKEPTPPPKEPTPPPIRVVVPTPAPPPPPPVRVVTPAPPPPPVIIKEPVIVYILEGKVFENVRKIPGDPNSSILSLESLPATVIEILGMSDNSSMAKRIVTDNRGEFSVVIEGNSDYRVNASKPSYFKTSKNVTSKVPRVVGEDTVVVKVELMLDKIVKNREIVLDNIYYDFDKADIREDARPTLDRLATLLFENPNLKVELAAHTDSRGSDSYNLRLSQQRAQSVVNYLVSKGLSSSRLVAKGYGEARLVNQCEDGIECSDEEHQQNRRTTFKVISEDFNGF